MKKGKGKVDHGICMLNNLNGDLLLPLPQFVTLRTSLNLSLSLLHR